MKKQTYIHAFTIASWTIIFGIFCTYFLLTFFVIAGVDDLFYSKMSRVYGFVNANLFFYNHMGSRYLSNILMTSCGANTNSFLGLILCEKYISISMCLMLPLSVILFIRALSQNKISWIEATGFALIFCNLYFLYTPALQSVLYWQASAATHTMACILMLFLLATLIRQLNSPTHLQLIVAVVLSILLPGTSESVFLVTLAILILGNSFIRFFSGQFNYAWLICTLIMIACLLLISFAHGNAARISQSPHDSQLLSSLIFLKRILVQYSPSWIFNAPLLFSSAFLFMRISSSHIEHVSFFKKMTGWHLILFMLTGICLSLFIPFLTAYLISSYYIRYWSAAFFIFLLVWFLGVCLANVICINHDIRLKFEDSIRVICLTAIAFFSLMNINFLVAVDDLLNNVALYNQAIYARFDTLLSSSEKVVTLLPLDPDIIPRTVYRYDLSQNPSCYFNYQYAFFFDKESIYITPLDLSDCVFSGNNLKKAVTLFSKSYSILPSAIL